jgi:hypothetical protein
MFTTTVVSPAKFNYVTQLEDDNQNIKQPENSASSSANAEMVTDL